MANFSFYVGVIMRLRLLWCAKNRILVVLDVGRGCFVVLGSSGVYLGFYVGVAVRLRLLWCAKNRILAVLDVGRGCFVVSRSCGVYLGFFLESDAIGSIG